MQGKQQGMWEIESPSIYLSGKNTPTQLTGMKVET